MRRLQLNKLPTSIRPSNEQKAEKEQVGKSKDILPVVEEIEESPADERSLSKKDLFDLVMQDDEADMRKKRRQNLVRAHLAADQEEQMKKQNHSAMREEEEGGKETRPVLPREMFVTSSFWDIAPDQRPQPDKKQEEKHQNQSEPKRTSLKEFGRKAYGKVANGGSKQTNCNSKLCRTPARGEGSEKF